MLTKRELNRVVRTTDGRIVIDPTGKVPGRGAYVCDNKACWLDALARKRFERALKVELSESDRAMIEAHAESLPAAPAPETAAEEQR